MPLILCICRIFVKEYGYASSNHGIKSWYSRLSVALGCKQKSASIKAERMTCGFLPHEIHVQSLKVHLADALHCSINSIRMSLGFPGRLVPTNENNAFRLIFLTYRLNMAPETSGQYIYLPMITRLYTPGAWRFPLPMITRLYTPISRPQFRTSVSEPRLTDKWISREDFLLYGGFGVKRRPKDRVTLQITNGYPRPLVTMRRPCIVLLNSPYFLFLKML
jgi:hypothetical protein